ncbi:MAG: tRNA-(ms[2]io[6]A)-hydroxylase [Crocinitomicaceae bacterium]|nr:tRNA-(ms[2]io[6]A)-hydroxylase [Crocinitomicaceae bacterium]|tara:strand:+ start:1747 stop:2337 length:591 start_codon:yes stop_codon:yes gene_type:complete
MKKDFDVQLRYDTPPQWVETVLADFDKFLQDHADCERKASAMAMSIIYKAPDRKEIIPELIETALEEMVHFRQVYRIMEERNVQLPHENEKDPYIKQLLSNLRGNSAHRYLDRLLLASLVEFRGAERFRLVAEALEEGELKEFYTMLYKSEGKHGNIFIDMALNYYDEKEVFDRFDELLDIEGKIVEGLPYRAALH